MNNHKFSDFLFLIFVIIILVWQTGNAQIIEDFPVLMPYDYESSDIGRSMGGASVAVPDSVPLFSDNPATLGQLEKVSLLVSYTATYSKIDAPFATPYFDPKEWTNVYSPGKCGIALPIKLFQHQFSIAASYNGKIQIPYEPGEYETEINYNQGNDLQSASIGFGGKISMLRFGIGATRFFGKRKVKVNLSPIDDYYLTKTSQFKGNIFFLGTQMDVTNKLSVGLSYSLPFDMSIDNEEKTTSGFIYNKEVTQKFPGLLQTGIAWTFNSTLRTGLGFRYQPEYKITNRSGSYTYKDSYSHVKALSTGIDYKLHVHSFTLPLHIKYQVFWLMTPPTDHVYYLLSSSTSSDELMAHQVELGANYNIGKSTFYLSAQWNHSGKYYKLPSPIS